MKISDRGLAFIRRHEGVKQKAYKDPVGVLTIGVGFTWRSESFREWWAANRTGKEFSIASAMTPAEIDSALRFLIDREYGAAVNRFLGNKTVAQHVFDAMTSVVFNLGPGALTWKWAAAAKRADYSEAARLLETTGTTAKGKRLPGLVRRRKEEAALLGRGIYGDVASPAPAVPQPDDSELILQVQALLRDKGYPEVGQADGKYGNRTRNAILAFQADNLLPLTGRVSDSLLSSLIKAPKRVETSERSEATKQDLSGRSIIKAGDALKVVGGVVAAGSAVGGGVDSLDAVNERLTAAQNLYNTVTTFTPWLLGIVAGGIVVYFGYQIVSKYVQQFREGRVL